ncbi:MAG: hypothetical protein CMM49_03110 [Rhodospirillaceae bacterium]|nr:hypothetical protein [Rhodospirillaceae bacterium]
MVMSFKIAIDTGGTFTDVVVTDNSGSIYLGKSSTTPNKSFDGVYAGIADASSYIGISAEELLNKTNVLIYGTTRATNAIVTNNTARVAGIFTKNFRDILSYRSGGKKSPFKLDIDPIPPFIPRKLCFGVEERVDSEGGVLVNLNEEEVVRNLLKIKSEGIEAIGVCLLWSIVNPDHEIKIGKIIKRELPDIPFTLSHELNPIIREYPRASSTMIDASLKPLMQDHLRGLKDELNKINFKGEFLISTSSGGSMHIDDVIEKPIYMVKSGPAMAPISGLEYSNYEDFGNDVIVVDTGGTTFDVSLVRSGQVKYSRDTWLIEEFRGHNLGMSSVDVRSIGSGGGSIAWVDDGGLLRVGPQSSGATPGPACYDKGGELATVTDAAVVLGYISPEKFLGGKMTLNRQLAEQAIAKISDKLKLDILETAAAIITISSETMIKAIEEITINEGVNPTESVIVAGGGAAGLNILPIAESMNCNKVIIPKTAGALSACGAHFSNIVREFNSSAYTRTDIWESEKVRLAFSNINSQLDKVENNLKSKGISNFQREYFCDARYLNQQWEIEIKLVSDNEIGEIQIAEIIKEFHKNHKRLYGVIEEGAVVECLNWKGRIIAETEKTELQPIISLPKEDDYEVDIKKAYFSNYGVLETKYYDGNRIKENSQIEGPAIIEETTSTLVVYPQMKVRLSKSGNYILEEKINKNIKPSNFQETMIDPVQLSVMSNRIDAITREMALTVLRSARSSVIAQSRDVSTSIVTQDNQILASAEGLPAHIFGANLQAETMCKYHPDLKEGQAFLHNDPYEGNSHAADISVLVPVFFEGEHMFTLSVKGHQADIGNALPTTYMPQAKDVYEEGALIFPAVKVQENYKDVDDIIRMCKRRIRVPEQWYGDYLSQVGAARVAEIRLKEFLNKYGKNKVKKFITEWLDYSERRCRNAIKKLPAGTLNASGKHDPLQPFLPDGIELNMKIKIKPDEGIIETDLTKNADCLETGLNLTQSTATCYGLQGVFNCLSNDIPTNTGSFRCVKVKLREGCCVGIPTFPHSCSVGTTNLGDVLVNIGQSAFTQLGEGFGLSQGNVCFGGAMGVISGEDWRNDDAKYINQIYLQGGGGPASSRSDGMINLLIPVGAGLLYRDSIEVLEQRFPMYIKSLSIIENSCGHGKFRGGPATEVIFGPRKNKMTVSLLGGGKLYPPQGVLGGYDSKPSYNGIIYENNSLEELGDAMMVELKPGQFICSIDSGGSGYGHPVNRDKNRVLNDIIEGYISEKEAETVYGVFIEFNEKNGKMIVNDIKTENKRKEIISKI